MLMNHDGMTSFAFKDVEDNIMKLILDIMYYGEADVPAADVVVFTETAKLLQITSLKCSSLNLSETASVRNTSEGNNASTCGVNLLKYKRNFLILENGVIFNKDVLGKREGGSNSDFGNIDVQLIPCPKTKERNILKELSRKVNEDQSKQSIPSPGDITNDIECRDAENLLDVLNPISFVAVPSVPVKSEEVGDEQGTSCISDLQLLKPLEENPLNCDTSNKVNFKQEQEFLFESQIKMENKDVIADYDAKKHQLGSNNVPCIHEMKQSFSELSANVEDNMLTDNEIIEIVTLSQL